MRAIRFSALIVICMCGAELSVVASEPDSPISVRVASYNVEFSKSANPLFLFLMRAIEGIVTEGEKANS